MTLEEAIILHVRDNLTETNDWYNWHINPASLPAGIVLPKGSNYEQNIALKKQLNELYLAANCQKKQEIIRYYIVVWGGIQNSNEKICIYALNSPESLICKGIKCIASWSKALSIRFPNDFSIYDSRVAVSLNCLQVVMAVAHPVRFPLVPGRNEVINEGRKKLCQYATAHNWPAVPKKCFYRDYNDILSTVSKQLEVTPHTIEMLLFAKAPELLRLAFAEKNSNDRTRKKRTT